jgi:ABC-2 type transport system permease protein
MSEAAMAEADVQARYGEVYDRGYQHYLGKRLGRRHAIWALITYSMKRAMGIKKSWTAKVIPIILYLAAITLVLVLIAIEAFIRSTGALALTYSEYFSFVYAIVGAFVATIAPEMLCGDRRENVLSLYFSRAISRLDYVLSKLAATAILTMTISVVPAVFLWLFRQLLADSPLSALKNNVDDLGRVVLIGSAIALYLGCGGLVISSFTGRKSIATAIIFIGYGVLELFINLLFEAVDAERTKNILAYLSPVRTLGELTDKLFGTYDPIANGHTGYDASVDVAVAFGVILIGIIIMVWRYVPED